MRCKRRITSFAVPLHSQYRSARSSTSFAPHYGECGTLNSTSKSKIWVKLAQDHFVRKTRIRYTTPRPYRLSKPRTETEGVVILSSAFRVISVSSVSLYFCAFCGYSVPSVRFLSVPSVLFFSVFSVLFPCLQFYCFSVFCVGLFQCLQCSADTRQALSF